MKKILNRISFIFLVILATISTIILGLVLVDLVMQKPEVFFDWPHFSLDEILKIIRDSGPWGVAVSLGLMIIHSFIPFPSEFVAIANGLIYGPFWGVVITWCGAMMGACVAFALAKKLGVPFVNKLLNQQQQKKLTDWTEHYGTGSLLFSRFIPIIAFNLINYAAGLANVKWWTFLWTTGLGILPLTIIMVIIGDQINTIPQSLWVVLLLIGLLSWLIIHRWTHRR
ncbi:MAG: TVP38/TMEM64 family protein [Gammaproteobacteria bacterium]|nr:TVP38/TMEM64 family protein [Gammaproteobacteria bacterium]